MAGAVASAFQGKSTQIKTPHWYYQYQQGKAQPELLLKHNYIAAYFPAEREGGIMDTYLQFLREEGAGLYKGYKYPNLIEVQKQSCLYVGYFTNVTDELVLAAFRGEEELTADEIRRVARYNGIHYSVLTCPKVITFLFYSPGGSLGKQRVSRGAFEFPYSSIPFVDSLKSIL